jgi:hypothetical protein
MTVTAVPDRGDDPKRKVKYSDLNVEKGRGEIGYIISHPDFHYADRQKYVGYSKKDAMKKAKNHFENL